MRCDLVIKEADFIVLDNFGDVKLTQLDKEHGYGRTS